MICLPALVACGTRTVIDATFGSSSVGETSYTRDLLRSLHRGMVVLADRNFAARTLIAAIADTGAGLLIRVKNGRNLPVCARLPDGSSVSRIGPVEVRVICCEITIAASAGQQTGVYRLITTILDPDCPATEIVALYHDRWEIETAFLELKSTILGGRVLRARTPTGVDQEIHALLVTYQALRTAILDATIARPDIDPDHGSFTIALNAARDELVKTAGVIADTVIDHHVLNNPMPDRRLRTTPRVVKRAISKFVASSAKGRIPAPSYKAKILDHNRSKQSILVWVWICVGALRVVEGRL